MDNPDSKIPLEQNGNRSSETWGPHYWFFLHTIAYHYPGTPTATTKRKYYDLIQNFPLFIPDQAMGNRFAEMLDKYPVTPYLDCRESFMRWVHFIHNKINVIAGNPEITLYQGLEDYNRAYLAKKTIVEQTFAEKNHIVHLVIILIIVLFIYWFNSA